MSLAGKTASVLMNLECILSPIYSSTIRSGAQDILDTVPLIAFLAIFAGLSPWFLVGVEVSPAELEDLSYFL